MLDRRGNLRWIDLHHRTHEHDFPFGMRIRRERDRNRIESFIDDAEESEAGAAERALFLMIDARIQRLGEMIPVDTAREAMHVGVQRLFSRDRGWGRR
jgi:hypothetical protein